MVTYIILPLDYIILITVVLDEINWYKIIMYLLLFLIIANVVIPIRNREQDVEEEWKKYQLDNDIIDAMEYKEFRKHYFYEHRNSGKISFKILSLLSLLIIIIIFKYKIF